MKNKIKPVSEQIIVITGASSGLGKGVALALAEQGATLVLAARRTELLQSLAQECESKGAKVLGVTTDVGHKDQVAKLMQAALSEFVRVDSWINNAGVGAIGAFDTIPLEDHEQVLQTNLFGTLYGTYEAFQQFRAQNYGIIINVSSMLGKVPAAYYSSYNTSKHGIIGLSATLRHEITEQKLDNIHICLVLPMAMNTPFFSHAANYTGHKAVPIPPTYDVQKGIDAIIGLVQNPRDEVIVGGAGILADIAHRLTPDFAESMTAKEVEAVQMKRTDIAAHTTGSIYKPVMTGTGVHQSED